MIWSTGLIEAREEETQGGKGGPSVTTVNYTYSASFAVGICRGPIAGIGRIWADGKLIRSAGQSLSVGGSVRFYLGDGDQMPDPLVEGSVGANAAPAYRGLAYAVFEALPLGEFVNRIPNLEFEVIAAPAANVAEIADTLVTRGDISVSETAVGLDSVTGYQVSGGQSLRDGLAVLTEVFPMHIVGQDGTIALRTSQTSAQFNVTHDRLGARPSEQPSQPRVTLEFDHALDLPEEITVSYTDPSTDYQAAVQRAQKVKRGGRGSIALNTAMALNAGDAQALAIQTLSRLWDERLTLSLDAGFAASQLEPGDLISVATSPEKSELFEVTKLAQSSMITSITARSLPRDSFAAAIAAQNYSGEAQYTQTVAPPSIAARVFELPATSQFGAEPAVYAAVSKLSGTLASAGLYVSRDAGVNFELLAQIPVAAVTGTCLNGLEDRCAALFDQVSVLDVMLDTPDMELASRPRLAILNGANLALVGTELLQFETAQLLENGAYRLSGLLRGRAGTEDMLMGTAAGQGFTLLSSGDIARQLVSVNELGTSAQYKIVTSGQSLESAPTQTFSVSGAALLPFAPVFLRARYIPGTGLNVSWIRRSRLGFAWLDGADAPLGEDTLAFLVTYASGATSLTRDVSDTQQDTLSDAEISSTFGSGPLTINVSVAQSSSTVGPGAAASISAQVS
ncbi:MAG: phage tail protein [Pseudomonadota bacterium]